MKVILIGPLTCDTIIKNDFNYKSVGGPVYYQSGVFKSLNIDVDAFVTVSPHDENFTHYFPENINLIPISVEHTMEFYNIYPNSDPNHRIQKAIIPHNPINIKDLAVKDFSSYDAILLGPLSPFDIPIETYKYLSKFDIPICLGAQGYLRFLNNDKISLKPWDDYSIFLKYVERLFIDENEARIILGSNNSDLKSISKILAVHGPEEVIITCGDRGALIYSKKADKFYKISSFAPDKVIDPTGLGDTFMAAYIAKRFETDNLEECGRFASIISSMKLEKKGFFNYKLEDIQKKLSLLNNDPKKTLN
ncbi:MAG: PfkB family carbohydrate kinase [Methanomicrobiales archaeon]